MITKLLEHAFTTDRLRVIATRESLQLWAIVGAGCWKLVDTIPNETAGLRVIK